MSRERLGVLQRRVLETNPAAIFGGVFFLDLED